MKPGYKTSEFIGVLISAVPGILTLLVILGVIGEVDVTTLQEAIVAGLTAVGALIARAVVIWKNIESRTRVKVATVEALVSATPEQTVKIETVME